GSVGSRSRTVTWCPSRASSIAADRPTMPPPVTTIFAIVSLLGAVVAGSPYRHGRAARDPPRGRSRGPGPRQGPAAPPLRHRSGASEERAPGPGGWTNPRTALGRGDGRGDTTAAALASAGAARDEEPSAASARGDPPRQQVPVLGPPDGDAAVLERDGHLGACGHVALGDAPPVELRHEVVLAVPPPRPHQPERAHDGAYTHACGAIVDNFGTGGLEGRAGAGGCDVSAAAGRPRDRSSAHAPRARCRRCSSRPRARAAARATPLMPPARCGRATP